MPIYEYRCSSCGHELEALQKFSDAPLAVCPACSRSALVKLVSAGGFQLKGSGWYATDFKGSGKKPAAKPDPGETKSAESKSEAKPEGQSETSSEAKSEAKSETKSEAKAESTPAPVSGPRSAGS
jgi:putative FmdB family regulatory protein